MDNLLCSTVFLYCDGDGDDYYMDYSLGCLEHEHKHVIFEV